MTKQRQISLLANLDFARGKVGLRNPLHSDEAKVAFANERRAQIKAITKSNTAYCGDERIILRMHDGSVIYVASRLLGGIGLATTKALVTADAAVLRDAKSMRQAYPKVSQMLVQMGYEDAGHEGCGASQSVESSVVSSLAPETFLPVSGLFGITNETIVKKNYTSKQRRLEEGFFGDWSAQEHQTYLIDQFPQNFAYLKVDANDHETHGHNGQGLVVITSPHVSYESDGHAFAVTTPIMAELAQKFGGSDEEVARIFAAFVDDTVHVGAGIVAPSFPVFLEAA